MVKIELPQFVNSKPIASGIGYYWTVSQTWRKRGCPYKNVPLGVNLSQSELNTAAARENERFEEWRIGWVTGRPIRTSTATYGTVRWMVEQYQKEDAFRNSVSSANRDDYANLYRHIHTLQTTPKFRKRYPTLGDMPLKTISGRAAYKLYERMCEDGKYRRGEKTVTYMKTCWKRMRQLFPDAFEGAFENPFQDMVLTRRDKLIKPMVSREMVYKFTAAALQQGRPEIAAAAILCFEWLIRPSNVIRGETIWSHYRPKDRPHEMLAVHHKNNAKVWQKLDELDDDGNVAGYYFPEAEEVLAQLPRQGIKMILGPDGQGYTSVRFAQLVRRVADRAGLPKHFTLDACRHGGLNELEDAELTEGQEMALSGHKTKSALRGYMKATQRRVEAATKKRRRHVVAEHKKNVRQNG